MKIGIVGYQGSGKSTLFEWLTGTTADPSLSHTSQSAMAPVPDERVEQLCQVYQPKKITLASIELVDTPGMSRDHEGNASRLSLIRDTQAMVLVVGAFTGADALAELRSFDEDLLLADLEIVSGRVERLEDSVKKPRPNRDEQLAELAALKPLLAQLEDGQALRGKELTEEQVKATRSFQLLSMKPWMVMVNLADDEADPERFMKEAPEGIHVFAVPVGLEVELSRMSPEERDAFREEMELKSFDRDGLLRQIMAVSGQMLFFTAGEKEVRTWLLRAGGTALEAADSIHSDMARGFIRAETMKCEDLIRLGSERELKAANLVRQEPRDYVVQDGDILNMKFSV